MRLLALVRRPSVTAGLLATVLITAGVLHLVNPRPFDSIVPRVLPESTRRPITYISGVAEIVCGALLLLPRTRALGGKVTALLFLVIWPANVDPALRGGYPGLSGFLGSALAAWLRVPLQIPLILWARSIARDGDRSAARTAEVEG
jgi:uncharacterized membrane protein